MCSLVARVRLSSLRQVVASDERGDDDKVGTAKRPMSPATLGECRSRTHVSPASFAMRSLSRCRSSCPFRTATAGDDINSPSDVFNGHLICLDSSFGMDIWRVPASPSP